MATITTFDGVAFGMGVRALRLERGWSLDDLAQESRFPVRTIGEVERGHRRRPSYQTVIRIADALGRQAVEIEALGRRLLESSTPGLINPVHVPPPSAPLFPLAA